MSTQDPGSGHRGDRPASGDPDPTSGTPAPTPPATPDPTRPPADSEFAHGSRSETPDTSGSQPDVPTLAEHTEPEPQPPTLAEYSPETAVPQGDAPTLAEHSGPDPAAATPPGSDSGAQEAGLPSPGYPPADQGQRRFSTPPRHGSIQRQEPGLTQPRPPTVAEARARDKARKRAEEEQRAAAVAEEAKKRTRKRMLIGGVAIVGVAGLVGGGYLAYRALTKPDQVTAYCTQIDQNGKEVVVDDDLCDKASASSSGGHSGLNGIFIYNGSQYRYYYGGNNSVGKPPTGGTTIQPKGADIKTKSGTSIQRGGLGSSSKSGSGS
ncbi:hypothetical protein [Nocardia sp. NBC_01009]|uniref:hypothetical protein n=1 Tax=Nocardia sp. NBC_01009 TaxID=2975996 RepID=UPI003866B5CE|nr:hypothetical protein OHA42_32330 [Nocardia sp. NBC_01009]